VAKRRARAGGRTEVGDLTPIQMTLMQLVWARGELRAAEARDALSKDRPVALTTVLTLLQRLEKRGWLTHRVEGRTHVYRALRDRKAAVGAIVRRLRDLAFGGSTESLLASLLDVGDVSAEEIARLRARLDDLEKGGRR
jgi:BlaI family penicillinase repressor